MQETFPFSQPTWAAQQSHAGVKAYVDKAGQNKASELSSIELLQIVKSESNLFNLQEQ